jgi:hypothetical protein
MKKCKLTIALLLLACASQAQFIAGSVLNQTVGRVIRAIDLKVQRMQNETIWLQNAQKALENELSKLRLSEIAGWSGKQQQLYSQYYAELGEIKSDISYYRRIRNLTVKQAAMIADYQNAWRLLHQDRHFNITELGHMQQVYAGMLAAGARNLDQIMLIINPGKTQMTDGQRLELINQAGDRLDSNYSDLKRFNAQNEMLSLQRAKDENEIITLKNYYGLH